MPPNFNFPGRCRRAARHAALCIALVLYTVFGGLVFRWLELPGELDRLRILQASVQRERAQLLISMARTNLTQGRLAAYEAAVRDAAAAGGLPLGDFEGEGAPETLARWGDPAQAVFFASTVLTTIGYGHITPKSSEGRAFCILFALVGIPLTVTVLADLGSLLASRLPTMPDARGLTCSLLTAFVASSILLAYVAVGSLMFISWEEEWNFFEGFYFCFVTMTTIGFGDYVPSRPQYMLMGTLYVFLGLALTSTIIEVVRQQYSQSWRHIQALAEVLGQLAADRGGSGGLDRRRMVELAAGDRDRGGWRRALRRLNRELAGPRPPPLVQIVIYESSV